MSDSELIAHIYDSFGSSLRRFIQSRVSGKHAAEDILQEAFLRISKGVSQLADRERLGPWVFRIARNAVADYYRSVGRTQQRDALVAPVEEGNRENANLNGEVIEWFPRFIDGLPESYGKAVRLYELEGRSQSEVAQELGISLSGAKSRIQRGRSKLASALKACCSFEMDRRGNVIDYEPVKRASRPVNRQPCSC